MEPLSPIDKINSEQPIKIEQNEGSRLDIFHNSKICDDGEKRDFCPYYNQSTYDILHICHGILEMSKKKEVIICHGCVTIKFVQ